MGKLRRPAKSKRTAAHLLFHSFRISDIFFFFDLLLFFMSHWLLVLYGDVTDRTESSVAWFKLSLSNSL